MTNPVTYFEIPVQDMDRAVRFYSAVFAFTLERQTIDGYEIALFPSAPGPAPAEPWPKTSSRSRRRQVRLSASRWTTWTLRCGGPANGAARRCTRKRPRLADSSPSAPAAQATVLRCLPRRSDHSSRNATSGAKRLARRAGIREATSEVASNNSGTTVKVTASVGLTP